MSEMTPLDIEREINRLKNAATVAYRELKQIRRAEIDAKHQFKRMEARALLGGNCPKVERNGATVAERDAWVYEETADQAYALDVAEVNRKNAEDHVREIQLQSSLTQTEARSVYQAYGLAGRGE